MMHVLRAASDWQSLLGQLSGIDPSRPAPPAPKAYPCLVTVLVLAGQAHPCFVYAADAARLNAELAPAAVPHVPQTVRVDVEHRRQSTALLLAIVDELEAIGAIRRDRFERAFARALSRVDQAWDPELAKIDDFARRQLASSEE